MFKFVNHERCSICGCITPKRYIKLDNTSLFIKMCKFNMIGIVKHFIYCLEHNVNSCLQNKQTALHILCNSDNINFELIYLLLDNGADQYMMDDDCVSPLNIMNMRYNYTHHKITNLKSFVKSILVSNGQQYMFYSINDTSCIM